MNWVIMEGSLVPSRDERRALIARVLQSQPFETSERLRELLIYLADRSNGEQLIREQEIGVAVFGRPEGYDTSHDTLVRVQISNLRKKLQQYFEEGNSEERWEIHIPKGNYALLYRPLNSESRHSESHQESREPVSVHRVLTGVTEATQFSRVFSTTTFWTGAAAGAAIALIAAALLFSRTTVHNDRVPAALASHPIWAPFRANPVTLAISTPLFFFSETGFERDFRLNYAEDLAEAPHRLLRQPASPEWDRFASFGDVVSVSRLQEYLGAMGSPTTVRSAREISLSDARGKKTIVLGHPRGAPFLSGAMTDLDFQPPSRSVPLQTGFINTAPRSGESSTYGSTENTPMERISEESPDYALVTSLRISPDGDLLAVFGNRVQTTALVVQKLLDRAFVGQLNEAVFRSAGSKYNSCQIVLRVDYSKGNPIGAVYVTHRIK